MKNYWITWIEEDGKLIPKETLSAPGEAYISTYAQQIIQKSTSPKVQVTLRASIVDPEFLTLIDGHKMQQIGLASGSVFCEAASTAAKYTFEYNGRKDVSATCISLHDPELLIPLTRSLAGIDGELITTAIMETPTASTILVSFHVTSGRASYNLGSMAVKIRDVEQIQTNWDRMLYFIRAKMEDRIQYSKEGSGYRFQSQIFYTLFNNTIEFSPAFRGV